MFLNKLNFNIADDKTVFIPESLKLLNSLIGNEGELFIE